MSTGAQLVFSVLFSEGCSPWKVTPTFRVGLLS